MKAPETLEGLTEIFRRLGARSPDRWASSQLKEGIPQLHRYLWLREAWKSVIPDEGYSWIESEIGTAQSMPDAPYSGIGSALERCLEKGADRLDLTQIVRGKQAQLLFQLCDLLEDQNFAKEGLADLGWGLFELDEAGNPKKQITGLHESVLDTDPTGREMRPKKSVSK